MFSRRTLKCKLKPSYWREKRSIGSKKRLGGGLEFYQEGSEFVKVEEQTKVEFELRPKRRGGKGCGHHRCASWKMGACGIHYCNRHSRPGEEVRVMSYQEERGRPIAQASFMNQYRHKTSKSALEVGKDITGISGATISSRAATFAVKKAVVFEEVYLKKK